MGNTPEQNGSDNELLNELQELREKNKRSQSVSEDRLSQIESLLYEKMQAEERSVYFEEKYEEIKASTFWKLTKPAREFSDKLKTMFPKEKRRLPFAVKRPKKYEKIFSILVPLYNTPSQFLREMIDSVQDQTCPDWELCLADASDDKHRYVGDICRKYAENDPRIKYRKLPENLMISGNTNEAAAMAEGRYIALLDHDDVLAPDAIEENEAAIRDGNWDVLYSDEDHLLLNGQHGNPFYKPDWSPDLLCSQMYICHFLVIRRELFEETGGFRSKYDGSQDYDLMLRLSEKTDRICHIPKILYSWRESESSTAANADSKPYAHDAGKNALDEHLKRVYGDRAHAEDSEFTFVYDARYPLPENTKVSVIIPMKDQWELTDDCVRSIVEKSTWKNYEVLILDNHSEDPQTKTWFAQIEKDCPQVRVLEADMDFNWSRLNNFGMKHADGDVFIFLNNDTKVISPDWMERLSEMALRKNTGVAGALLLYSDGTIQHAGVVVGMKGTADHVFKGMRPAHFGAPFVSPMVTRNVLAVTGACMAVSRKTIEKIGEFDETFIICGSDVELGIRAYKNGLVNVYDASVRLYHLESKSRDSYIPKVDFKRSTAIYAPFREGGDPYFNPNLNIESTTPRAKSDLPLKRSKEGVPSNDVGEITPIVPRKEDSDAFRLNLLIPSVDERHAFGGISTAVRFFEQLCDRLDCEKRIITTDSEIVRKHMILTDDYVRVKWSDRSSAKKQVVDFNVWKRTAWTLPVRKNDVFVATGWWTAYAVREVNQWQKSVYGLQENHPLIYMIQDYEPGFYAWSSRFLLAESTYRMDIPVYAVFNSGLLMEYFDKLGYRFEKHWCFEPTLNAELKKYLPENRRATKKKQILVYGRPGTPRNAFELVCMSLRRFVAADPEKYAKWTFLAAGEKFVDVDLGSGAVLKSIGKLSLGDYAETMLETYAGISLMASPHPSYPPLEMSSFGIKTITNSFFNKDLSGFSSNIITAGVSTADEIAGKLEMVCSNYQSVVEWEVNEAYVAENTEIETIIEEISGLF